MNTSSKLPYRALFLHGLDSSSQGTKGSYFKSRFPDTLVADFTGSLSQRMDTLGQLCQRYPVATLIGSSFGGLMATLYALQKPNHLKRLILLAPALNFADFSPPATPCQLTTKLYIGKNDTVTPADQVIPLAQETYNNIDINLVEDDHFLSTTFLNIDWPALLTEQPCHPYKTS